MLTSLLLAERSLTLFFVHFLLLLKNKQLLVLTLYSIQLAAGLLSIRRTFNAFDLTDLCLICHVITTKLIASGILIDLHPLLWCLGMIIGKHQALWRYHTHGRLKMAILIKLNVVHRNHQLLLIVLCFYIVFLLDHYIDIVNRIILAIHQIGQWIGLLS